VEIPRGTPYRAFLQVLLESASAFFVDVVAYCLVNEATAVAFARDPIKQPECLFR
jgi:hypothetical protein